MELQFVNHAAVVCAQGRTRLISDPWLYGSAFNDGWDLICRSALDAEQLGAVQYIWFSHEHPDHFSPRVLADVPPGVRRNITVLSSAIQNGKIRRFCEKLGYQTRELVDGIPLELGGGDLRVTCYRVPLYDSVLVVEGNGRRVLNANDAVFASPAELAKLSRRLGELDVLLTQFSYAAWRGNASDTHIRSEDARRKLGILGEHVRALRPRFTIPFASMSYFSHEENQFMNDEIVKPWQAASHIERSGSTPVLLYPGDRWSVGSGHDNRDAEQRYKHDYARIAERPRRKSRTVPLSELREAALKYLTRIKAANGPLTLSLLRRCPLPFLSPLDIHLWDLELDVRFTFEQGLQPIEKRTGDYDLRMGSDSLNLIFREPYGVDTLTVNGRFYANPSGLIRLMCTFGADLLNNAGIHLSPRLVLDVSTLRFLVRIFVRKMRSLRTRMTAEPERGEASSNAHDAS